MKIDSIETEILHCDIKLIRLLLMCEIDSNIIYCETFKKIIGNDSF